MSNPRDKRIFIGLDGEGQNDGFGRHRYVLLAGAGRFGEKHYIENPRGLSTVECLDFIAGATFPKEAMFFAYSFGYDLTKILEDIDDATLYKLFRPELRKHKSFKFGPAPINWRCSDKPPWTGYRLNYINGKFSVAKQRGISRGIPYFYPSSVVHDIWRFFGGKFTTALEDWRIGSKELIARMVHMKDQRKDFDKLSPEAVRNYCFEECMCMAELARRLDDAHNEANIPLRSFYGAGSSGTAMLKKIGIADHIERSRKENPYPAEMTKPIAAAFFGGRFENSVIGPIEGPLYSCDISSAYPYHTTFLPCLIHGTWERSNHRISLESCVTALVRYRVNEPPKDDRFNIWGPFPFRTKNGSIAFPKVSGGGWVWKDEFLAGEAIFPNVEFLEAWVYRTDCDCQPFKSVPEFYILRIRIGKEGAGIVIKLGVNSVYGKLAQSLGGIGLFTSWIWAGLITSGCRAQVLQALALHRDWRNLLMVATDGIATRENLEMPRPKDTGTWEMVGPKGEKITDKPLGGWEKKQTSKGLFLARPGIYFPLNPTEEEIKQVRGRGVGRGTIYKHWSDIVTAFAKGEPGIRVKELQRFIGAKTAISRSMKEPYRYKRSDRYGQWISRPVDMSFDPMPKRASVIHGNMLELRSFPGQESVPYDRGLHGNNEEALALKAAYEESLEQPDGGDLADLGIE